MPTKRKKFWITFSVIVFCVMILSIVMSLVTRLKTVNVEFRSRLTAEQTHLAPDVLEKVKQSGEFDYGKNVVTMSFSDNIKKIEKANPFVKVEQVVRYFPNRACVYISERQTKYRLHSKDDAQTYYILDDEFKVLDVATQSDGLAEYLDTTVEVLATTLTVDSTLEAGDFVPEVEFMSVFKDVMSGVYGITTNYYFIDEISLPTENSLTFKIKNSRITVYINSLKNLKEKVAVAVQCYVSEENIGEKTKIVVEERDGNFTAIAS